MRPSHGVLPCASPLARDGSLVATPPRNDTLATRRLQSWPGFHTDTYDVDVRHYVGPPSTVLSRCYALAMAITGVHALLYTPEAEALRAVLRDGLGWNHVQDEPGWLIFALPPAELGVHPSDKPAQELSLMCDDIQATMTELRTKGVEFSGEPVDRGWGVAVTMVLPGGVELLLYEPRHSTAI